MWEKIMQGDFGTRDFWELICIVMDPTCEKTFFGKCKECMFDVVGLKMSPRPCKRCDGYHGMENNTHHISNKRYLGPQDIHG